MLEIERKFLISDTQFISHIQNKVEIAQGYLSKDPHRTVRVRMANQKAWLTVKGISSQDGTSRLEIEKELSIEEGCLLLDLCLPEIIKKTRYYYEYENQLFEIDVFHGKNEGLYLAEIELKSTSDTIILPPFLGKEVTQDRRYYNSYLSDHPYNTWS